MARAWRIFWVAVLASHLTVAVLWWWLMPGGFGLGDSEFWINRIIPWIVIATAIGARVDAVRQRWRITSAILLAVPVLWFAAAVTARTIFPVSFAWRWLVPAVAAAAIFLAWRKTYPGRRITTILHLAAAGIAIFLGIFVPLSQRSAAPATRPLNPNADPLAIEGPAARGMVRLGKDIQVDPADAVVTLYSGRRVLGVQPVLTFISRSPDRCWTLFAPRALRLGPPRRLVALDRDETAVSARLRDDCDSALRIAADSDAQVQIDSRTTLAEPIYSHLNTYCELTLTGHRRLYIEFSPCPGERIEVTPGDYPFGRPHRCAYLDAGGAFRVVQARSAEKGPFTELASGKLARGEPLVMTFFDEQTPVWRVAFADWSAQASVAPSPAAGYGLPQNSIEFSCEGDDFRSPAGVYITLAATSVGRGYQSVGHTAGTYRNRMIVSRLTQ